MYKYKLAISIVSHGHGQLLPCLLLYFNRLKGIDFQVILTINIPENESFLNLTYNYPLKIIRNSIKLGFGHNHNNAFEFASSEFFLVLNPDIILNNLNFSESIDFMSINKNVGILTGVVRDIYGSHEDNLRKYPTFFRIFKRFILRIFKFNVKSDYVIKEQPFPVEWVAGLFILILSNTYARIGGFDQRYFMYYEDADLCMRCRLYGYDVICFPSFNMIHNARRSSFKSLKHLFWHIKSSFKAVKLAKILLSN